MSDTTIAGETSDSTADDRLDAVEESAVWLELNGSPAVTWMCTPERLDELVVGWLFGEGYIDRQSDIVRMRPCTSEKRVPSPSIPCTRPITSRAPSGVVLCR